jgi:hypothetical protein
VTSFPLVNDDLTGGVPTLRNFETWGVHCKFVNISGRIKNHPRLQGGGLYFPLIIIWGNYLLPSLITAPYHFFS